MPQNKNQHYVPKRYFRWFASDAKRINLVQKQTGNVVLGAGIKGQSSREYFYGDKNLERTITDLETEYLNALAASRNARSLASLPPETFHMLRAAALFQRSRTRLERRKMVESAKGLVDETYKVGPPEAGFERTLQRMLDESQASAQRLQLQQLTRIGTIYLRQIACLSLFLRTILRTLPWPSSSDPAFGRTA